MSCGHRRKSEGGSVELERELKELLAKPEVKKYLNRRFNVDRRHDIPLTGGSNVDGSVYYLDRRLPGQFVVPVLEHERVEKALRSVLNMTYDRAHRLATVAEKLKVESLDMDWATYKRRVAKVVRRDEHEDGEDIPKDLDLGPYRGSNALGLINMSPKTRESHD